MYKDRGIIKWAPFDALVGFKTNIQDMIRGKNKQERPLLSEDQLSELNQTLHSIKRQEDICLISYYEAGQIKSITSKLMKIDAIQKEIILEYKFNLKVTDVVNIEVI